MLSTHLHLSPTLRMSGAIPLLPLHAFMAWAGSNFYFINSSPSARYEGIRAIESMCLPIINLRIDGLYCQLYAPEALLTGEKLPLSIEYETARASGPFWTFCSRREYLACAGNLTVMVRTSVP
jgi:hypothetical protein